MMKYLSVSFLIFFCCISISNYAQSMVYSCNGKYRIELPSKLELQSSELSNINKINVQGKKPQINISTQSGRIIFQQKGLNANVRSAFSKYCRVIIEYFTDNRNVPTFGRGDAIVVDRELLYTVYEAVKENCRISETPLINILSTEAMGVNGFPALYYSYRRMGWQKEDGSRQPPVIVNVYTIFNKYELVKLTFSYRESERKEWKSIHNNIISTFSFIH